MNLQYILTAVLSLVVGFAAATADAEMITFETTHGAFTVQTFDDTPVAVNNFKQYIEQSLLVDSFVHFSGNTGLITGGSGSIIWGGQYTVNVDAFDMDNVNALAPVSAPSETTHSNVKYTITMAQTGTQHYTSGWFINMTDNTTLDGQFTAWGEVVEGPGRDVLDTILNLPTANLTNAIDNTFGISGGFSSVPFDDMDGNPSIALDELVRLTAIHAPEPTSLAVLALGSLAMLRRRII